MYSIAPGSPLSGYRDINSLLFEFDLIFYHYGSKNIVENIDDYING